MQQALQKSESSMQTYKKRKRQIRRRNFIRWFAPLLSILLFVLIWQVVATIKIYPAFIIPPPIEVARAFREALADGTLLEHTWVTFQEVLAGLIIGASIGVLLGYWIARHPILEDLLSPVIVAFQSTPVVAYAPLLIIWFGSGPTSKVVTSTIIVFFPILVNTIVGIRAVPSSLHDLMQSLRATRWQILTKLEVPSALPVLLAGLKTSATLAVIGAVVGEFISAGNGLGHLVTLARNQYDTPLVLVAVFTMTAVSLLLYGLVTLLQRIFLSWQYRGHNT